MANVKISALTAAASVAAADQFPIVQGGTTKVADGTMAMVRTGGLKDNTLEAAQLFKLSGVETTLAAAVGGGQAGATAISTSKAVHIVTTCASDADSIKLPAASGGGSVHVIWNSTAKICQVFGAATETINGVASATGVALAAGKAAIYVDYAAGTWLSLQGA